MERAVTLLAFADSLQVNAAGLYKGGDINRAFDGVYIFLVYHFLFFSSYLTGRTAYLWPCSTILADGLGLPEPYQFDIPAPNSQGYCRWISKAAISPWLHI
ncbi:MAG: hypothetical protein CSA26_05510 [Desulfobacterales bacterium]|nr:MAG: hypothetical protein CSA26_05510 [Desulfobacterales bacterium]